MFSDIINFGRIQGYNVEVARFLGSINAAIFLNIIMFFEDKSQDGWIFRTEKQIEEDSGLSRYAQECVRIKLKNAGYLTEKKQGIPQRLFYKINWDKLNSDWVKYMEDKDFNSNNSCKQDCGKTTNKFAEKPQTSLLKNHNIYSNKYINKNSNKNNNIENKSCDEEKSIEQSQDLVVIETTHNSDLIEKLNENKKSNLVYSFYQLYLKYWSNKYKKLNSPKLTPKVSGQIKNILKVEKDLEILERSLQAFFNCPEGYLISKLHDIGLFLSDINKWLALAANPQVANKMSVEYCKTRMYIEAKEKAEEDKNLELQMQIEEKRRIKEEELKRAAEEEAARIQKEKEGNEKLNKIIKDKKEEILKMLKGGSCEQRKYISNF